MTIDIIIQTVLGLAVSAFWFYVRNLSDKLVASDKANKEVTERLHKIELEYQSRADAIRESNRILELLREIRTELKELNAKLDTKADK